MNCLPKLYKVYYYILYNTILTTASPYGVYKIINQFAGGQNGCEAIYCIFIKVILLHRESCNELEEIKLPALTVAPT